MRIGVTVGDPAGIGPEIVDGMLRGIASHQLGDVVVFGHATLLPQWSSKLTIVEPPDALGDVVAGQPNAASGRAQVQYLEACARWLTDGKLDAVVTAPIHKQWAHRAGFAFPGHTEFFAHVAGRAGTMLFAGPRLRVSLATVHVALKDAIALLADGSILHDTIVRTATALRDGFGLPSPRIAIAGLNPHAGEGGEFGDEETRFIAPAIEAARAHVPFASLSGPCVPDAVFRQALIGEPGQRYDAVIALYHDQGLIPVKVIDFDDAVNVTIGLPFVRTSPDHGVAYDIAGRGIARATSMRAAWEMAVRLLRHSARGA